MPYSHCLWERTCPSAAESVSSGGLVSFPLADRIFPTFSQEGARLLLVSSLKELERIACIPDSVSHSSHICCKSWVVGQNGRQMHAWHGLPREKAAQGVRVLRRMCRHTAKLWTGIASRLQRPSHVAECPTISKMAAWIPEAQEGDGPE